MSTLGVRFADFALVGMFCVFILLLPYGLYSPDVSYAYLSSIAGSVSDFMAQIDLSQSIAVGGILVTSVLVVCIVVGFFLHLLSELIMFSANKIFAKNVRENEDWFSEFICRCTKSDREAVRTILEFDERNHAELREWRRWFLFWKRSGRKEVSFLRGVSSELEALRRLETRMLCYIYSRVDSSTPAELANQLRYFHVGRSIGASLVLSFFLFAIYILYSALFGTLLDDGVAVQPLIVIILVFLALFGLFFADRPYSRFCRTLFALVYEYFVKERREDQVRTVAG